MSERLLINVQGLTRAYPQGSGLGSGRLTVLQDLSLSLQQGEQVALIGASGTGKSTLLHLLGLLDTPTAGTITFNGQSVGQLNDHARTRLRREQIGFVYQFHHLLPDFTALENVMLPQLLLGVAPAVASKHAMDLLVRMNVNERSHHKPAQLSGGEQQRVALARALVNAPSLLLADEPTGNLDPATAEVVLQTFRDVTADKPMAAIIATHDHALAARFGKVYRLEGGKLHRVAA